MKIYTWNKGIRNIHAYREKFMNQPWATGMTLIACVMIAMLLANLPFTKDIYHGLLNTDLALDIGDWIFPKNLTISRFVNDILMVIFFFTVGLEIRRELAYGELSSLRKAMMPVIAALGGVMVPAIIFFTINHGTMAATGWGIPTATDIAFAVGIMSILGDKVPLSMKVFLTALAIVDDLVAIIVVAVFYGEKIDLTLLLIAILIILFVIILKKLGEKRGIFYLIPALAIWALFYHSGIHATMSGVVMAFIIPMEPRYNKSYLKHRAKAWAGHIINSDSSGDGETFPNGIQMKYLGKLSHLAKGSVGLGFRLEHALTPWVNFVIMPIFALANAGVEITNPSYFNIFRFSPEIGSAGMGIFLGLVLGKPVGITLASWIAIKTGVGEIPSNTTWKMLFAVACLGGIGFTMSLFVDTLSFGNVPSDIMADLRNSGKIAILLASLTSGILGSILVSMEYKAEHKKSSSRNI